MGFVANFIRFQQCKKCENQLRFDKVIESIKVGTFLRHSVEYTMHGKSKYHNTIDTADDNPTDNRQTMASQGARLYTKRNE